MRIVQGTGRPAVRDPAAWHAANTEDVLAQLESRRHGLTADEIGRRLRRRSAIGWDQSQPGLLTVGACGCFASPR
jgi:hypothetical protein